MDLVVVGQCWEQHFRMDITGTPGDMLLEKAQVLLASRLLSFLIQFQLQELTVERGRTVSPHLNRTAETQAEIPAQSLNYNGNQ